jgi:hypothetical protein
MGVEGFEPTRSCDDRFTVCCSPPTLRHSQKQKTDSEGFELSEPFGSVLFKSTAIDHSANCPNVVYEALSQNVGQHDYRVQVYAYQAGPPSELI